MVVFLIYTHSEEHSGRRTKKKIILIFKDVHHQHF